MMVRPCTVSQSEILRFSSLLLSAKSDRLPLLYIHLNHASLFLHLFICLLAVATSISAAAVCHGLPNIQSRVTAPLSPFSSLCSCNTIAPRPRLAIKWHVTSVILSPSDLWAQAAVMLQDFNHWDPEMENNSRQEDFNENTYDTKAHYALW